MTPDETLALYSKGKDSWNDWAEKTLQNEPREYPIKGSRQITSVEFREKRKRWEEAASVIFRGHNFEERVDFKGWKFPHSLEFTDVHFHDRVKFSELNFQGDVNITRTTFDARTHFIETNFHGNVEIRDSTFKEEAVFFEAQVMSDFSISSTRFECVFSLDSTRIRGLSSIRNSVFEFNVDFSKLKSTRGISIHECDFEDSAVFSNLDLTDSQFRKSELQHSDFTNSILTGADFIGANLSNANLLGVHTNTKTDFTEAVVDDCKINRYALECLENYGGLSKGSLMKMDIHDAVAELRQNYSGYLRMMHLVALLAFTFPYAWFLFSKWGEASFFDDPAAEHIPLWLAFCRYVYNGGISWETGFVFSWSFIAFCLALAFNGLRGTMLWKTKKLEFHQEVKGFPVEFSLVEPIYASKHIGWFTWGLLQWATNKALLFYFLIVAANAIHFMQMEIPLASP